MQIRNCEIKNCTRRLFIKFRQQFQRLIHAVLFRQHIQHLLHLLLFHHRHPWLNIRVHTITTQKLPLETLAVPNRQIIYSPLRLLNTRCICLAIHNIRRHFHNRGRCFNQLNDRFHHRLHNSLLPGRLLKSLYPLNRKLLIPQALLLLQLL